MKIAGLRVTIDRTAYVAFVVLALIPLVVIFGYTAIFNFGELGANTFLTALWVGICFAAYHEIAQFVHQLGHALVAHMVGYPMIGVRYFAVFSFSEYPANEPALPDKLHIQRSLGGVGAFALLFLFTVLLWLTRDATASEFMRWLLNFLLFHSVLLLTTSALLSDGLLFILNQEWKVSKSQAHLENS